MNIRLHPTFTKHYRARIAFNQKLDAKSQNRIKIFQSDRNNPVLKDHQLSGAKRYLRSFRITGDIRVIYKVIDVNEVELMDIGTHNQVY